MTMKQLSLCSAATMSPRRLLRLLDACEEGVSWASVYSTSAEAWAACSRPDWLLWVLLELKIWDEAKGRLFACWCVRNTPLTCGDRVWDLLTSHGRVAVEVAELYSSGRVSGLELQAAFNLAAWDVTTVWLNGTEIQRAAATAAAFAANPNLAASPAHESALAAAGNTELAARAQADALRRMFGNPASQKPTSPGRA
jgi:hypothetical protein